MSDGGFCPEPDKMKCDYDFHIVQEEVSVITGRDETRGRGCGRSLSET